MTLTPKAFETLLVLVRHNGHIVEKEQLLQKVWPDNFVEEGVLNVNIFRLRKALGEDGQHRFIETVPRRGYRFVAQVREVKNGSADLALAGGQDSGINNKIDSSSVGQAETVALQQVPTASGSKHERVRWRPRSALLIGGVLLVGLAAALFYWVGSHTGERDAVGKPAFKSLAVLPFKTVGAETGEEYLSLGMADALITKLSNFRQVVVRPTSAVVKYDGQARDALFAGNELKVETVLEGSVQRANDRVRVTVRSLDVREGRPLWAEKFDARWTDILAVQDQVSEQVARALVAKFGDAEAFGGQAKKDLDANPKLPSKSVPLKCLGAERKTPCTPVITTTNVGTVTIQITKHANGGQLCGLYSPTDSDRPGDQIIPDGYIDPSNMRPQTFSGTTPAGTKFVVWCKRDSDSGNADIRGYIYHR